LYFVVIVIEVVEVWHYVALERCIVGQRLSVKWSRGSRIIAGLIGQSSWMTAHIGEY